MHSGFAPGDFAPLDRKVNFETAKFIRFLQERRSHRHFLKKPVPRKNLETLMEACRWAPTGSNVQNVEVIVYTDREKIDRLSDLTIEYFLWVSGRVRKKLARMEAEGAKNSQDYRMTERMLTMGDRMKNEQASGRDPVFYHAPVLMIFHSVAPTSAPKDNAVLAAHTVALTARTLGIESCYIGIWEAAAEYYPPLKEALNLPPGHKLFDTLILGYPKLRFLKTVPRKPIRVRWE
jgi:nitroreductase